MSWAIFLAALYHIAFGLLVLFLLSFYLMTMWNIMVQRLRVVLKELGSELLVEYVQTRKKALDEFEQRAAEAIRRSDFASDPNVH